MFFFDAQAVLFNFRILSAPLMKPVGHSRNYAQVWVLGFLESWIRWSLGHLKTATSARKADISSTDMLELLKVEIMKMSIDLMTIPGIHQRGVDSASGIATKRCPRPWWG